MEVSTWVSVLVRGRRDEELTGDELRTVDGRTRRVLTETGVEL